MSHLLRCLTLNLWGTEGPMDVRMRVIEQGLRALRPDVIALQEVREIPGKVPNQAATLASALGMDHVFAIATPLAAGTEGLAILSRAPIEGTIMTELPHARRDDRRILFSARLATDSGLVWVSTTHLHYRLGHGKQREDQVLAVDASLANRETDAPQILMGDFNARPESDEIRFLCGLTTLAGRRTFFQDAWALSHPDEPGWTWASSNPYTERLAFLQPDRRIDYIFVSARQGDGRGAISGCRIALDRPTRAGVYASDHFALVADVQLSAGPMASTPAAPGSQGRRTRSPRRGRTGTLRRGKD